MNSLLQKVYTTVDMFSGSWDLQTHYSNSRKYHQLLTSWW